MIYVMYVVQGLFCLMAFGLFSGFFASKNVGLLFAALAFGGSAVASMWLVAWWPLGAGLILAWILRLLGMDPGHRA